MVLIARAQGLARIKVAASAQRDEQTQSPLRPKMKAVRAHYDGGDRGTRNNSHSDAFNQWYNGPITTARVLENGGRVFQPDRRCRAGEHQVEPSHSACGHVEQNAGCSERSEECTRARCGRGLMDVGDLPEGGPLVCGTFAAVA